jgi:hypothetical protein
MNGCNRFVGTKNIGIEPPFAIVARVTIFDYFLAKNTHRAQKGVAKMGHMMAWE